MTWIQACLVQRPGSCGGALLLAEVLGDGKKTDTTSVCLCWEPALWLWGNGLSAVLPFSFVKRGEGGLCHLLSRLWGSHAEICWRSQALQPSEITEALLMKKLPPQRKGNPRALVGLQNGAATSENSMRLPQNIKNRTTLWTNNSTSGCFIFKHLLPNCFSSSISMVCNIKFHLYGCVTPSNPVQLLSRIEILTYAQWSFEKSVVASWGLMHP